MAGPSASGATDVDGVLDNTRGARATRSERHTGARMEAVARGAMGRRPGAARGVGRAARAPLGEQLRAQGADRSQLRPVLAFDRLGSKRVERLIQGRQEDPASEEGRDPVLRCCRCGHEVTREDARGEISGKHVHQLTNPFGFTFTVGCFWHAQGCQEFGPDVAADSWFPGYRWTLALCGGCGIHLGWRYTGSGPTFHGLVLVRLCNGDSGSGSGG